MPTDDAPSPDACLAPTYFLDSDHSDVVGFAQHVCLEAAATTDRERAVALFLAVRDGIRYDPYAVSADRAWYRASNVLHQPAAYCIPKAVLLTAAYRAVGLPSRLAFADVRNHLRSGKLTDAMGTDLFAYHGYSEVWLDGHWLKVSSAFNRELCDKFGTQVLEFDGIHDALMHPYDRAGNRHMEYVRSRGSHADLPFDEIMAGFAEIYGQMSDYGSDTADTADAADPADRDDAFDA